MQWDDIGYLLSKNKYNENSIIAEFYTERHGKCSGIIFGGTSKKIKNYLEIGNSLHINYNYKQEGRLGYFKVEVLKVNTPFYFEDKKKLFSIISAMNLVKLLTVDFQENTKIYNLINDYFLIINQNDWVKKYIFWELKLLEYVGFNLELNKIVKTEGSGSSKKYFVITNSTKKFIPNFLLDTDQVELSNAILFEGLKLVGDFLEKNILKPNNINYPNTRLQFINLFK
tara:strand:+ start:39 stop:719 length:681 start_codon:yes stop_codon:yes gene_type:complete